MTINLTSIGIWVLRLVPALILLQTLFYKFSGADESVFIFSELGMEPWGRIGSGILELIAALLLLYPRTTFIGAALGMGLMAGAIFFHLTKLGISVQGDGGLLFIYALLVFISCGILLFIQKKKLTGFLKKNIKKNR
jgi:uncharacterized membrane protein YphA (DoxX/SURF4 family)